VTNIQVKIKNSDVSCSAQGVEQRAVNPLDLAL
jgi:hypothetical protein